MAMVLVGITTEEMMRSISESVGKVQKAYDVKIEKVKQDLTKKVDSQQESLNLLTSQLNKFSQGIESSFANLKNEQAAIFKSLDHIRDEQKDSGQFLESSINRLTAASASQSSTIKHTLETSVLDLLKRFNHQSITPVESIDGPPKDVLLPMLTDQSTTQSIDDSPPDPGEIPCRL